METSKKAIATFRIYPWNHRGLYFTVRVFPTKKKMTEYCRRHCFSFMGNNTQAVCHNYQTIDVFPVAKKRFHPETGDMHFYKNGLYPIVVAHECTHAAVFWLQRILRKDVIEIGGESRGSAVAGAEEKLCVAAGNLFRDCNLKLHAFGLWQ